MNKVKKISSYIAKLVVLGVLFCLLFYLAIVSIFTLGFFSLIVFPAEALFFIYCTMRLDVLGKGEKAKARKLGYRFLSSLPLLIPSVFLGLALSFHEAISDDISDFKEYKQSGIYYSQADEFIGIDGPVKKVSDGIMDTPLEGSTIMIDYDTKRVSFILSRGGGMLFSYKLSKDVQRPSEFRIQSERSLSSPGKTLRTYYKESRIDDHTSFVELELENGEIWSSVTYTESFGIHNEFPLILEAVETSDKTIEYLDTELPQNEANMQHPSLLFDFDRMYAFIVYKEDFYSGAESTCRDFKLTEYDYEENGVPDMEIVAKIELDSPWKEVYIYRHEEEYYRYQNGLVLLSEDGKMYLGECTIAVSFIYGFEDSKYAFSGDEHDIEKSLGIS